MSWLWKSNSSSPASFEKALSKLSNQITTASLSLENTRSRGRRAKALWTLYTTITFLVALLILVLVIGPQNWTVTEYGGLLGGSIVIYSVRTLMSTIINWQAGRQQKHLDHLKKQRDTKIADLKKATKYDSTQELLQRYGGAPPKENPAQQAPQTPGAKHSQQEEVRTGIPPPPTANIPTRPNMHLSTSPVEPHGQRSPLQSSHPHDFTPDEPGFAPNAFPPQHVRAPHEQISRWYDRILDVLLGEDETQAKNRLVLLCQTCRLVNGQAPPGVKTLEQLGKWRCANCGTWNGEESEVAKVVKEIQARPGFLPGEGEKARHSDEVAGELEGTSTIIENDDQSTESDFQAKRRVTRSAGKTPVEGL